MMNDYIDALLDLNTEFKKIGLNTKERHIFMVIALRLTRETTIPKHEAVERVVSAVHDDYTLHGRLEVLKPLINCSSSNSLSLFFTCCLQLNSLFLGRKF